MSADQQPRRACLNPACARTVPPRYAACKPCWMALPKRLRRAIETSYPTEPGLRTLRAATGRFKIALDDARESWRSKEPSTR